MSFLKRIELLRDCLVMFGCTKPGGRPLKEGSSRLDSLKGKKGATCAVKRKSDGVTIYYRTAKGRNIEDKAKATRKKKRAAKRTRLQKLREKVAKRKKEGTYIGRGRAKPKGEKDRQEMQRRVKEYTKILENEAKYGNIEDLERNFYDVADSLIKLAKNWDQKTKEKTEEKAVGIISRLERIIANRGAGTGLKTWGSSGIASTQDFKVRESGEDLNVKFDYDTMIVGMLKKIKGRKWDSENRSWTIPKSEKKEVGVLSKFARNYYRDKSGYAWQGLKEKSGGIGEPNFPSTWSRKNEVYVARLEHAPGEKIHRNFIGKKKWRSRNMADIVFAEEDHPGAMPVGEIIEIRNPSRDVVYYRKDPEGWKNLGMREEDESGWSLENFALGWKYEKMREEAGL